MPDWVLEGVQHFRKYLQTYAQFNCIEIPLEKQNQTLSPEVIQQKESLKMLAALPVGARIIALDVKGETFTSEALADKLRQLQHITSHLCLMIGGPHGLHPDLIKRANERWSLSALTLPHTLARVVLLEALYRAFSILHHSPYHR